MKQQIKKLHQAHRQGNNAFTIIEVMIVLAIAGIIMVIVFLAIPALQRNSRNTQRTSDITRMTGAIDECLANNNSVVASCNNFGAAQLNTYITVANNQQITTIGAASVTQALLAFNTKCNPAGTASAAGGGTSSFTLVYLIETGTGTAPRCVGS